MLAGGSVVAIGSGDLLKQVRTPADLCKIQILLHRDMPNAFHVWRSALGMPELQPAEVIFYDAG